jgi:hypothetical protein
MTPPAPDHKPVARSQLDATSDLFRPIQPKTIRPQATGSPNAAGRLRPQGRSA